MPGENPNCDSGKDEFCVHHDWHADTPVSLTLMQAVAAVTNTPQTELDPLFETVDPAAVDALFEPLSGQTPRENNGRLTIRVHECRITIHDDGCIIIQPPET